jgi:magnesium transporter
MRGMKMKKRSKKAGLPPGTAVHIGEKKTEKTRISLISYGPDGYSERQIGDPKEFSQPGGKFNWVNMDGVYDVPTLEKICSAFKLHPLVVEDIANTDQRPKYEDYGEYLYVVLRMLDTTQEGIVSEQMSLVIGQDFVLSFQEVEGDVFNPVRERIRKGKGKIRSLGPDYLAYTLIDAVVDDYFSVLELIGDEIEGLEEQLAANPDPRTLSRLHHLKTELILLRKSIWPLREVVAFLEKGDSKMIKPGTRLYLRDVYDHTIHVIDTMETFRDMTSGMIDIYLSSISYRLNEIMKVLTIFGTVFLPLTFIVGVYGMNFRYMPELEHPYGYYATWVVIISVAAAMLFYFRKKKWI